TPTLNEASELLLLGLLSRSSVYRLQSLLTKSKVANRITVVWENPFRYILANRTERISEIPPMARVAASIGILNWYHLTSRLSPFGKVIFLVLTSLIKLLFGLSKLARVMSISYA